DLLWRGIRHRWRDSPVKPAHLAGAVRSVARAWSLGQALSTADDFQVNQNYLVDKQRSTSCNQRHSKRWTPLHRFVDLGNRFSASEDHLLCIKLAWACFSTRGTCYESPQKKLTYSAGDQFVLRPRYLAGSLFDAALLLRYYHGGIGFW